MSKLNILIYCMLIASNVEHAFAQTQTLITDDGREISLNADGTWEFKSNDRFVTSKDGKRIRLKADGSWVIIGEAPIALPQQDYKETVKLNLEKVIEEQVIKKIQKNVRVSSQMVFYIDVQSIHGKTIPITADRISQISIKDSQDNYYPVLSISPSEVSIKPNMIQALEIRVEGAPSPFSSAKTIQLEFAAEFFNTQNAMKLNYRIVDIEEKEVSRFE